MKINYISKSDAINGYNESLVAKGEKNDCVVRAIASASGMNYDKAHKFVAEYFNRKNREGVYYFNSGMDNMQDQKIRLNRKKVIKINRPMMNGKSRMTVGAFIKKNSKGSYILSVKGHAFTVKDGSVIGNPCDAVKIRKILLGAWKIGCK
jgi:hypothetical protein